MLRSKRTITIKAENPVMDIAQEICDMLNATAKNDGSDIRFSLSGEASPKNAMFLFYDYPGRHSFENPSSDIFYAKNRAGFRWSFDIAVNTSSGLPEYIMINNLYDLIHHLLIKYKRVAI